MDKASKELDAKKRMEMYAKMQRDFDGALAVRRSCCRTRKSPPCTRAYQASRWGCCLTTRATRASARRDVERLRRCSRALRQHPGDAVRPGAGHVPDRPGDADRSGHRHRRRSRPARRDRRGARPNSGSTSRCSCSSGSILRNLVHGDLGRSVMTSHPVTGRTSCTFFPATLELATTAIIIAVIIGVPLGVFAASRQGSRFDHVVRVISLAGQSVPVFVLGLLCLLVFYVKLGIAPGTGQLDVAYEGDGAARHRHAGDRCASSPATGIRSGTRWRTWRSRRWCWRISRWPTSPA